MKMGTCKAKANQVDLGIFTHIPAYSDILRHNKVYSGTMRHNKTYSGIFRTLRNAGIRALVYTEPWCIL